MKFKDLKNILSVCDEYEISLEDKTLYCDAETIDEVTEENNLDDKEVIFIKASDEDFLYICLKNKKLS